MRNTKILQTLCDCNAQTICGLCTIPRPCSNFNCCHTLSSRWQRQWLKRSSVRIPHEPAMDKHEYTTSPAKFMYVYTITKEHCSYVNYLWPNIHSLVLFGVLQCMTIYGIFLFVLSHETCVFHHIPSLAPRLSCVRGLGTKLPYISDQL